MEKPVAVWKNCSLLYYNILVILWQQHSKPAHLHLWPVLFISFNCNTDQPNWKINESVAICIKLCCRGQQQSEIQAELDTTSQWTRSVNWKPFTSCRVKLWVGNNDKVHQDPPFWIHHGYCNSFCTTGCITESRFTPIRDSHCTQISHSIKMADKWSELQSLEVNRKIA